MVKTEVLSKKNKRVRLGQNICKVLELEELRKIELENLNFNLRNI